LKTLVASKPLLFMLVAGFAASAPAEQGQKPVASSSKTIETTTTRQPTRNLRERADEVCGYSQVFDAWQCDQTGLQNFAVLSTERLKSATTTPVRARGVWSQGCLSTVDIVMERRFSLDDQKKIVVEATVDGRLFEVRPQFQHFVKKEPSVDGTQGPAGNSTTLKVLPKDQTICPEPSPGTNPSIPSTVMVKVSIAHDDRPWTIHWRTDLSSLRYSEAEAFKLVTPPERPSNSQVFEEKTADPPLPLHKVLACPGGVAGGLVGAATCGVITILLADTAQYGLAAGAAALSLGLIGGGSGGCLGCAITTLGIWFWGDALTSDEEKKAESQRSLKESSRKKWDAYILRRTQLGLEPVSEGSSSAKPGTQAREMGF
jgi:hypothetical protein